VKRAPWSESWLWSGYALPPPALRPLILVVANRSSELSPGSANRTVIPKWLNVVRAISSEGFGRLRHHMAVRRLLAGDRSVRRFFEGESDVLPRFYEEQIRRDLGPLWDMLPPGALAHDQNVYLKAHGARMASMAANPSRPSSVPDIPKERA
jgi:hypothetical protein